LVLPTSSATRYFSFFVNPPLLLHHPRGIVAAATARTFRLPGPFARPDKKS
jgi:hypothetical protein